MYPPCSFSLLPVSILLHSSAVSSFSLPPTLPPPPPWSSLHSLLWADDYSNKKYLQITTVIQTPALQQLPGLSSCAIVPRLYLSSSFPFLSMSHMMTPPWPSAVLSLVVRWPSRESCITIVLLCINGGPEVGLPATVICICWDSLLIYLYCSIVQQPPSHFLWFSWSELHVMCNLVLFLQWYDLCMQCKIKVLRHFIRKLWLANQILMHLV